MTSKRASWLIQSAGHPRHRLPPQAPGARSGHVGPRGDDQSSAATRAQSGSGRRRRSECVAFGVAQCEHDAAGPLRAGQHPLVRRVKDLLRPQEGRREAAHPSRHRARAPTTQRPLGNAARQRAIPRRTRSKCGLTTSLGITHRAYPAGPIRLVCQAGNTDHYTDPAAPGGWACVPPVFGRG